MTVAQKGEATLLMDAIIARCNQDGIDVLRGGSTSFSVPRINVFSRDISAFNSLVRDMLKDRSDEVVYLTGDKKLKALPGFVDGARPRIADLGIVRHKYAGTTYVSRLEIGVWHQIQRFGSHRVVSSRANSTASRADDFQSLLSLKDLQSITPEYRNPGKCAFPIDVVFTWVDGSDPEWRDIKDRYYPADSTPHHRATGHLDERYKSRDELRYALRSISMYAPFVRKVYLVTADQKPCWLDESYGDVSVVAHREIFSRKSHLPTFNSHSIESQLHHIDGLSEHFIYMNDDMFFGAMVEPEDFFDPNGLARIFPELVHVRPELINAESEEYLQADAKAVALFRRDFRASPSQLMSHVPYAVRRSVMYEIEAKYAAEWDATASHRFRSPDDLAPISFFYAHYAALTSRAYISTTSNRYVPLWSPKLSGILRALSGNRSTKCFCLNDAGVPVRRAAEVDSLVREFLDHYFPIKSPFEV